MTEEQNVNVEAPATEVAPVEPAVEPTQVADPAVESEAPVEPEVDLSMDFGAPAQPPQQQVAPQENYDDIVDELAERLVKKQGIRPEAPQEGEAEDEFFTKSQVKDLKEEIRQELMNEAREQEEAQTYVRNVVAESQKVKAGYVQQMTEKLGTLGINLTENKALQSSADYMWKAMEANAQRQVGRILTPQEIGSLKETHWKEFSEIYVKPLVGSAQPQAQVAPGGLGVANEAVNEQPQGVVKQQDPYALYQQKKAAGQVPTAAESLQVLSSLSSKN